MFKVQGYNTHNIKYIFSCIDEKRLPILKGAWTLGVIVHRGVLISNPPSF